MSDEKKRTKARNTQRTNKNNVNNGFMHKDNDTDIKDEWMHTYNIMESGKMVNGVNMARTHSNASIEFMKKMVNTKN